MYLQHFGGDINAELQPQQVLGILGTIHLYQGPLLLDELCENNVNTMSYWR